MYSNTSLRSSLVNRALMVLVFFCGATAYAQESLPVVSRGISWVRAIFSYEAVAGILGIILIICIIGWAINKISLGQIIKILIAGIAIGAVDGIVATLIRLGQG